MESGEEEVAEWRGVAVSASHCGAGCAFGDIIGEWVVFAGSVTIAGAALWPEYIVGFAIAYLLGTLFQYFAIKPMSDLNPRSVLSRAVRADTLSLVAFEVGMFAWMALVLFAFFTHPHLQPDHAAYWLMMQVGMALRHHLPGQRLARAPRRQGPGGTPHTAVVSAHTCVAAAPLNPFALGAVEVMMP